jgi:ribonuclease HII
VSLKFDSEALKNVQTLEALDIFEASLKAPLSKTVLDKLAARRKKLEALAIKYKNMSVFEHQLVKEGLERIAGIDEAGRGPLAGPVVAAAVVLNPDQPILGLDDSKKLSEKVRERLFDEIMENAISVGIGFATREEIDSLNILEATKLAARRALESMEDSPQTLLLDALELDHYPVSQLSLIKGDQRSVSIAAASVIAKVTRDRYMVRLSSQYPAYAFDAHKGYGTERHYEALRQYGLTPEHRRSFLKSFDPLKSNTADSLEG